MTEYITSLYPGMDDDGCVHLVGYAVHEGGKLTADVFAMDTVDTDVVHALLRHSCMVLGSVAPEHSK